VLSTDTTHVFMRLTISVASAEQPPLQNPWVLCNRALTIFCGCPELPRLPHYFLTRLLFAKKQILYLDGANKISPLLLARFARERGVQPAEVSSLIRVARLCPIPAANRRLSTYLTHDKVKRVNNLHSLY